MSWLSNFLGTSPIRHDFNYDVNTADYKTDPRLLASMGDLNRTGGRFLEWVIRCMAVAWT